jgi:2-keto-4-pentenoate hydratase
VFCMLATPPVNASLDELFACIDWVAPGFEIVQSHLAGWKFAAADAVADGALHARLVVGQRTPVRSIASAAQDFCTKLAACTTQLSQDGKAQDQGAGANVLGDPLHALQHFLQTLRQCPNAPDLLPGDVITTGTWTDAWPVAAGQTWNADFGAPLSRLELRFN